MNILNQINFTRLGVILGKPLPNDMDLAIPLIVAQITKEKHQADLASAMTTAKTVRKSVTKPLLA